jgi:hypothetical protein
MMTIANRVYASFTKKGIHNWGFLNLQQADFDLNDEDVDSLDPDWLLVEMEEKEYRS